MHNPWAVYLFPSDIGFFWSESVLDGENGTVRQSQLAGDTLALPKKLVITARQYVFQTETHWCGRLLEANCKMAEGEAALLESSAADAMSPSSRMEHRW